jgi:hypothetical protein
MLLFVMNALPAIGTVLDAVGSFIISIFEIVVVFGGLWFIGLYKGKRQMSDTLLTLGISAADLIPIVDDIPFTTPTVFFMIMKNKAEAIIKKELPITTPANDNRQTEERKAA